MSRRRIVRRGDCLSIIAFETGFFVDTLWKHPDNAALRETRTSPYVLMPGDEVVVPDITLKTVQRSTGARYRFRRKGVPARLSLRLLLCGEPRANLPYALIFQDGSRVDGTTRADGSLEEFISPAAKTATLVVNAGALDEQRYELALGGVTPACTTAGVATRLVNLGFLAAHSIDDDAAIEAAVRSFQRVQSLEPTGVVDERTEEKLRDLHGD